MELKVKRDFKENVTLPTRAHDNDAGLDLYSRTYDEEHMIVGEEYTFDTGVQIELPPNHVGLIIGKSSMNAKGVVTFTGVIDEGYRGNLIVVLSPVAGNVKIHGGQKIAQLLVLPVAYPQVVEVNELSDSDRGIKGFGSSGS